MSNKFRRTWKPISYGSQPLWAAPLPPPEGTAAPICSGLGARGLITTSAEASRTHGCQALPSPKGCQLTTKNCSLKSKEGVSGQITAWWWRCLLSSSFFFQYIKPGSMKQQLYVIIKVGIQLRSVLQSNGQDSTPAICSQQYLGLAVCVHTRCPCLTQSVTPSLTALHTIYNHVLWYGCRRHQPPLRPLGGHLYVPCLAVRILLTAEHKAFFFLRHLFANNRPKQFEVFPVREVLLKELCHFDFSYTLGSALRFVNSYLPSPMPQAPDLEHSPVPILVTADEEKVSHDSRAEHCHFQPLEALWDLLVHQANIGLRASSGATATSSSIIPAVNLSGEAPLRDRTAELQGAVLPTGSWGLLLAPHQQTGASENHLSQEHRVLAHTPNLLPSHYLLGVIVSFPNS